MILSSMLMPTTEETTLWSRTSQNLRSQFIIVLNLSSPDSRLGKLGMRVFHIFKCEETNDFQLQIVRMTHRALSLTTFRSLRMETKSRDIE